jgi:hydrogenase nickel incorporation protein HypA/HybF
MHEHALMADIMREVLKTAAAENARAVTGVSVWLGALSHMTPEHFAEHFEDAAAGTIAAGARIGATVSTDINHPRASGVVIEGVEIEPGP